MDSESLNPRCEKLLTFSVQEAAASVQTRLRELCARARAGAQEQERLAAALAQLHAQVPQLLRVTA